MSWVQIPPSQFSYLRHSIPPEAWCRFRIPVTGKNNEQKPSRFLLEMVFTPSLALCGKCIEAIWIGPDLKTIMNHG